MLLAAIVLAVVGLALVVLGVSHLFGIVFLAVALALLVVALVGGGLPRGPSS